jgi:hypothetical protein
MEGSVTVHWNGKLCTTKNQIEVQEWRRLAAGSRAHMSGLLQTLATLLPVPITQ